MKEGSSGERGVPEKNMFSKLEISEFLGYTIYYLLSTSFYEVTIYVFDNIYK